MADMAELAAAAYQSGDALKSTLNRVGWIYADYRSVNNAQAFCAERVVDGKREMVISFRGTEVATSEGFADILVSDFGAWGFVDYYKKLRSGVEDWLVKAYLGNYDKVCLTGHSLGGKC